MTQSLRPPRSHQATFPYSGQALTFGSSKTATFAMCSDDVMWPPALVVSPDKNKYGGRLTPAPENFFFNGLLPTLVPLENWNLSFARIALTAMHHVGFFCSHFDSLNPRIL